MPGAACHGKSQLLQGGTDQRLCPGSAGHVPAARGTECELQTTPEACADELLLGFRPHFPAGLLHHAEMTQSARVQTNKPMRAHQSKNLLE